MTHADELRERIACALERIADTLEAGETALVLALEADEEAEAEQEAKAKWGLN